MATTPEGGARRGGSTHARALDALARRGRLRRLEARSGLDFTSNDYLGLAQSALLVEAARAALDAGVPVGAGGSRLLRGNHEQHEALEAEAAAFFGSETALFFGGGFPANAALFATLPAHGDLIVHDELIHASAWEGMGSTKAETRAVAHNDVSAFEDAIRGWRGRGGRGRVYLAVESLYSMDGDVAPLAELGALADRHEAMLLIDEAHATGVLGPGGRGLAADMEGRDNVVTLHTCGKALGSSGALVAGPRVVRDFLVNRARAFIYATAPPPLQAAIVRRALAVVRDEPERRTELAGRVRFAHDALAKACGLLGSGSQILPVVVGSDARAVALAARVRAAGFDVRAIRPPTVPEGTARLRITLTLNSSEADIAALFETLREAMDAEGGGVARDRSDAVVKTADTAVEAGANGRRRVFVVTGTGTGVGKTVIAAALTGALDADYWKPVQSGDAGGTDTEVVRRLTRMSAKRLHPEAYRLGAPLSPHQAARIDGVAIDAERLATLPMGERPLVIEGAGGVLVPLSDDLVYADMMARWGYPVVLVARTELGTISHSLLSIEALRARGVPILGVAFVGPENADTEATICRLGGVRRLGRLPVVTPLTPDALAAAFAAGFDLAAFAEAGTP